MDLMICLTGEPDQWPYLQEIETLGAGIELGSYGLVGVQSESRWAERLTLHQAVRRRFSGALALHGPFVGVDYGALDHLIREANDRRLDLTFDAAISLGATRVVLHSGYGLVHELFELREAWLKRCAAFWRDEIGRWADARIEIVIENDVQRSPDLLVRLAEEVDNPCLGLCLDVGHQHLISKLPLAEWVERMEGSLLHLHVHDNDRSGDKHWSLGRGTIDFDSLFAAVKEHAPRAIISLEVEDTMAQKMSDLRMLAERFSLSKPGLGRDAPT